MATKGHALLALANRNGSPRCFSPTSSGKVGKTTPTLTRSNPSTPSRASTSRRSTPKRIDSSPTRQTRPEKSKAPAHLEFVTDEDAISTETKSDLSLTDAVESPGKFEPQTHHACGRPLAQDQAAGFTLHRQQARKFSGSAGPLRCSTTGLKSPSSRGATPTKPTMDRYQYASYAPTSPKPRRSATPTGRSISRNNTIRMQAIAGSVRSATPGAYPLPGTPHSFRKGLVVAADVHEHEEAKPIEEVPVRNPNDLLSQPEVLSNECPSFPSPPHGAPAERSTLPAIDIQGEACPPLARSGTLDELMAQCPHTYMFSYMFSPTEGKGELVTDAPEPASPKLLASGEFFSRQNTVQPADPIPLPPAQQCSLENQETKQALESMKAELQQQTARLAAMEYELKAAQERMQLLEMENARIRSQSAIL